MANEIKVTVGPAGADFTGCDDLVIQAAIEYVVARGGGTVELRPGTFRLQNSVRLRSHVRLVGAGDSTVLVKEPSVTVPLTEDTDWYEWRVTVADASAFRVGGGVMLQAKCPHYGQQQVVIHTVRAIEGNTLWLMAQARGADGAAHTGNFWLGKDATASTLFSPVTANWVTDFAVASLRIDGNRGRSAYLNGNYGAAMYFQDCERVHIDSVHVEHIESDALSFQIVHDLTVVNCVFEDVVQGLHPGSGSQRPVMRNNLLRNCSMHGLGWCWGVKHGIAEKNTIEDCKTGISIGHRDTDNVMRNNVVRRCRESGLVFRGDPAHQAAHDNLIEDNRFEDIGVPDAPGYGIDISAPVRGTVLRRNRIVCSRPGLTKAGIRIGPQVERLVLDGNVVEGAGTTVEDLRKL